MATTMAAIDVAAPIRSAYDRFADPESHVRFMDGIRSVRQDGEGSAEVHGVVDGEFLTWRLTWRGLPPRRLEWHSPGAPEQETIVTFEELNPHLTRVTMTRTGAWPVGEGARHATRTAKDLERFRSYVEAFERDPWIEVRPPIVA